MGEYRDEKRHGKTASKYTEDQERSELVKSNKEAVMSRFTHFSGEKILDMGCGYGLYTDYFRSIGADVIGIDGSKQMIHIAQKRYPLTSFSIMDITTPLSFQNDQFDIVFSNQVLMDIELEDENGYKYAKAMDKYIKPYQYTNLF